jgi:hypothetical protein
VTQKGCLALSKVPRPDGRTPKIVPLSTVQEQADAAALARYWDARLQGQPVADTELDPELRDMVQLLEHYRKVAGPVVPAVAASPPLRPVHLAALAIVATVLLLFASHTLLSPRSWLLSSAQDPDWIPWVSDDWLGGRAPSAGSIVSQLTAPLTIIEEFPYGA